MNFSGRFAFGPFSYPVSGANEVIAKAKNFRPLFELHQEKSPSAE